MLQDLTALGLKDNCIHLASDGALRSYPKRAAFVANAVNHSALMDGRVLGIHEVTTPQDVHYPAWEMHPAGDELLILESGSIAVELRDRDATRTVPLTPRTAAIVPAGIWHRVVVQEPSVLIAITPRRDTLHETA